MKRLGFLGALSLWGFVCSMPACSELSHGNAKENEGGAGPEENGQGGESAGGQEGVAEAVGGSEPTSEKAGIKASTKGTGGESKTGESGCEPTVELCDGKDNDCDGLLDEDFDVDLKDTRGSIIRPGSRCDGKDSDSCATGKYTCSADGLSVVCKEDVEPHSEVCDGVDNDCDGETDEGFSVGEPCDSDDDDDLANGIYRCANGIAVCSGDTAPLELCNNLDDDGNGSIDEGLQGKSCDVGCGLGIEICTAGQWICNKAPRTAICPNPEQLETDVDCDGTPDVLEEGLSGAVLFYHDADRDGFPDKDDKRHLCPGHGDPKWILPRLDNSWDCCDIDAQARPDQTEVLDEPNACGNLDYSCDG